MLAMSTEGKSVSQWNEKDQRTLSSIHPRHSSSGFHTLTPELDLALRIHSYHIERRKGPRMGFLSYLAGLKCHPEGLPLAFIATLHAPF